MSWQLWLHFLVYSSKNCVVLANYLSWGLNCWGLYWDLRFFLLDGKKLGMNIFCPCPDCGFCPCPSVVSVPVPNWLMSLPRMWLMCPCDELAYVPAPNWLMSLPRMWFMCPCFMSRTDSMSLFYAPTGYYVPVSCFDQKMSLFNVLNLLNESIWKCLSQS